MKVKDAVHELIRSLTKSEKRYFKLLSSRHTIGDENNYILIFDFIDKQEEYNEENLFTHFKGQAFLNKFSITKKRLYDHILAALDAFHIGSSVEAQIYKLLHSSEILYNKSLYNQCRTVLRSAERLAEKHDCFNLLLEISKKQKRLFENKGYAETTVDELQQIFERDEYLHRQSSAYNQLWNSKSQLFISLSRKGVSRSEEEIAHFKAIIDLMEQKTATEHFYFDTQYLYHHIYSAYYFAINDFENCLKHLKINISCFEKQEIQIEKHPNNYFSILTNAIFVSEKLGDCKEANRLLETLKRLPEKIKMDDNEDLQIKLFSSINSIELNMLTSRGEFDKAEKLSVIISKGFELYGDKITPARKAFLAFKLATVYLSLGQLSQSLKWINCILNDKLLDEKEDLLSFAQLLHLIVHIEMNNKALLPYALKNTQRFLRSRNRLYGFEKVFMHVISKIIKSDNRFEIEELWEEVYLDLEQIKDDALQSVALEYFDFQSWAESKFKLKSFGNIVFEKFERRYLTNARA